MDTNMKEKIEFLKKYTGLYVAEVGAEITIFQSHEIASLPANIIPESWYQVFAIPEPDLRIQSMMSVWKTHQPEDWSVTIDYLEDNLDDVELMRIKEDRYFVLYSVRDETGELQYYVGGNPLEPLNNSYLEPWWEKAPESIRYFYENLHNGYYDYACGAMGMVASQNIDYLGDPDYDWEILEDLDEPLQIDLSSTFGFFSNFMGGYVAIDLKHCNLESATLWFSDDQPEYHVNFWDIVDEWTTIGMLG